MSERKGWVILAVGVFLFAVFWLGFALAMYLYSTDLAERILQ
jgi:hypothetical protein